MLTTRSDLCATAAAAALLVLGSVQNAQAVPAFARQTGQNCVACHVSFPELTPFGRYFKLTGYTIGIRQKLPFAMMAQASVTSTKNNTGVVDQDAAGNNIVGDVNQRNNSPVFTGASLFLAGKATNHLGGFLQWTYDNLAENPNNGELGGHTGADNMDIRLANIVAGPTAQQPTWIYGFTVHNNPTVQDVWNSTPAFGFPFTASELAQTPAASTMIDGTLGQQVTGLGGYVFWHKTIYGELTFYRTADGPFSFMRWGQDIYTPGGVFRLDGYNPYWRLAYNREWGPHSLMVGTYGMRVDVYPDNTAPFTQTDRYTDTALDAQYQYITDPHTFTAQATYIHEKQDYRASYVNNLNGNPLGISGPTPNNPSDTLNTVKLKATYYYRRKYGGTLAYVSTTGSSDAGLYAPGPVGGFTNNVPDSRAYIAELDYLPLRTQNVRLMLQYTYYAKFNGGSDNYDGFGRNARDNNTLFFNVWVAF